MSAKKTGKKTSTKKTASKKVSIKKAVVKKAAVKKKSPKKESVKKTVRKKLPEEKFLEDQNPILQSDTDDTKLQITEDTAALPWINTTKDCKCMQRRGKFYCYRLEQGRWIQASGIAYADKESCEEDNCG